MCEGLNGGGVVEDEDKVCELEADLAAETTADGADGGGGGPGAVVEAGDDDAGAEAAGTEEAGFEDGDDGETLCTWSSVCDCCLERLKCEYLCASEDFWWDDLVGTKGLVGIDE